MRIVLNTDCTNTISAYTQTMPNKCLLLRSLQIYSLIPKKESQEWIRTTKRDKLHHNRYLEVCCAFIYPNENLTTDHPEICFPPRLDITIFKLKHQTTSESRKHKKFFKVYRYHSVHIPAPAAYQQGG